jgi:porin
MEGNPMKFTKIVLGCCYFIIGIGLIVSKSFAVGDVAGWHHGAVFAYKDGLLGPLGGKRAELSDHGVDLYLSTLVIGQSIVKGGLEKKDKLSSSYDLQVYLDSSKLGLWQGGYGLVRAEGKAGLAGVNPYTGAIIPVNFDAVVPTPDDEGFLLTEWSYTQAFADGKVEALAGMYDIGRFYDIVPFSGPYPYRFLNAHMFFNSVLLEFAPYNLLGGLVLAKPTKWWTITTGISDPNSSADEVDWFDEGDFDLLHEWRFMARPFGKPGWYTAGIAYRDKEQATIAQDPTSSQTNTTDSDWAFYANFNQWLYQNPKDPHQAIGVFGRIGITDGDVNIIKRHYSLGVSFDGMIPSRPKDIIGIVGWYNEFSDDLPDTLDDSSGGFEAYYSLHLPRGIRLSADVQYLIEPGLVEGNDDTLVLGLRALVLF